MLFNFNATSNEFTFYQGENLVDTSEESCKRCAIVEQRNWASLQVAGGSSFFPFTVHGGRYYISDVYTNALIFAGNICAGVLQYECYMLLLDGYYQFRLGAGLLSSGSSSSSSSSLIGINSASSNGNYPLEDAFWEGCGTNGTSRCDIFSLLAFCGLLLYSLRAI
jgi:hypothetical protein